MTENLEQPTFAQLEKLVATEKARNNEIYKYIAAAIDRQSTAVAVVGFLGPVVGLANSELDHKSTFYVVQSAIMLGSAALSYGLHLYGKLNLKRGLSNVGRRDFHNILDDVYQHRRNLGCPA